MDDEEVDTPGGTARLFNTPKLNWWRPCPLSKPSSTKMFESNLGTKKRPEFAWASDGKNLGRDSSLTLLQLFVRSTRHTYVFDVKVLGDIFCSKPKVVCQSLKKLLECKDCHQIGWACTMTKMVSGHTSRACLAGSRTYSS